MGPTARLALVALLAAGACAPPPVVPPTPPSALPGPLRLLDHGHRAQELLVFERPGSRAFVASLLAALEEVNAERPPGVPPVALTVVRWRRDPGGDAPLVAASTPVHTLAAGTRYDVWLQDVVELGVAGRGPEARPVLLGPYRRPGGLSEIVPELALRWDAAWVPLAREPGGEPDGGGNVEALPGGLLLLGSTAGPVLTRFLLDQGYAGRQVRVDTSWLEVGHVDELLSHVITDADACGFSLVRASPALGLALAQADPDAPRWLRRRVGDAARPTRFAHVQEALDARIRAAVAEVRAAVAARRPACAGLAEVALPVLFECNGSPEAPRRCWASLANPVNLTVVDRHVLVPDPVYVPFARAVEEALRAAGQVPHLLDAGFYHQQLGGVHCATNVRRDPRQRVGPRGEAP